MNKFFKEHYQLIHQEWLPPDEIKNLTILDLGSETGWLGKYCTTHGVKEYIGVEIDKNWIDQSRSNYPHLTFIHMDLEEYLDICIDEDKFFDIIIISRTMEGVHNQVSVLQKLSKITNHIVLEIGIPVNFAANEVLKTIDLPDELRNKLIHYVEYEHPFVEYFDDDQKFVWAIPSIGLYNSIMTRLGFQLSLDTYEKVKQQFPTEYGYLTKVDRSYGTAKTHIGKGILKFKKVTDEQKPLTWREWYEAGDK
jgi:trans-aconitate methyltransferase